MKAGIWAIYFFFFQQLCDFFSQPLDFNFLDLIPSFQSLNFFSLSMRSTFSSRIWFFPFSSCTSCLNFWTFLFSSGPISKIQKFKNSKKKKQKNKKTQSSGSNFCDKGCQDLTYHAIHIFALTSIIHPSFASVIVRERCPRCHYVTKSSMW